MSSTDSLHLWYASTGEDREAAYRVRLEVFVKEQGVPPEEELDELDENASHLLAAVSGVVIGTARLVVATGSSHPACGLIGRVAVLPEWRRQGIAGRMLEALELKARELGLPFLELHSQTYVTDLYAKRGFEVIGGGVPGSGDPARDDAQGVVMCRSRRSPLAPA